MKNLSLLVVVAASLVSGFGCSSVQAISSTDPELVSPVDGEPTHVSTIVGLSLLEALHAANLPLEIGNSAPATSVIIAQDPIAGTPIAEGMTSITAVLFVPPTGCTTPTNMPNLKGLTIVEARVELCDIPMVILNPPATSLSTVLTQSIAAGTKVPSPMPPGYFVGVVVTQSTRDG